MCTVSWLRESDSYTVFFNRDELKTRSRALPPTIKQQNGVRYIAPTDVDGGGTWLGVNEFGLTCGLLNNYSASVKQSASSSPISRGLLVVSLLACPSLSEALIKLQTVHLGEFRSFLLALFAPDQAAVWCIWNGESLQIHRENVESPLSSSSFDTNNVVNHRQQEFCRLQTANQSLDPTFFESYHASHSEKGGAYSVCMHRDDAETVSFSRVRVTSKQIEFAYKPDAPCRKAECTFVAMGCIS
jgi:uncharacterized protein with NRDE domain